MTVFETDHVQVLYTPHRSDYLLITFGTATMRANGNRYFGSNLTNRDKITTLGFVAKRPNWYPAADMAKLTELVSPILDCFEEKVSIGHSMGGYAVLKYAKLLQSTTSIAICPQYSIDPSDIPAEFEADFKKSMTTLRVSPGDVDPNMRITRDSDFGNIFVVFDNKDKADSTHVALIKSQVSAVEVPLPYTGHRAYQCFADADSLATLITLSRANNLGALRAYALRQRKTIPARILNIGWKLAGRHPRWGMQLLDRHAAALANREWCMLASRLAKSAVDFKNFAWAAQALEKVVRFQSDNVDAHRLLATAYVGLDETDHAIRVFRRLVELAPQDATVREKLVRLLVQNGHFSDARFEVERAVRIFPDNARLLNCANDVAQHDGKSLSRAGGEGRSLLAAALAY